jgi:hypothetical protein
MPIAKKSFVRWRNFRIWILHRRISKTVVGFKAFKKKGFKALVSEEAWVTRERDVNPVSKTVVRITVLVQK